MKQKKRMIVVKSGNHNTRKTGMICCGFGPFARH